MEDKKDYLVKTLSKTERKDYENYVINRLYAELNDLDIKPMTQKYVKAKNRHYYLIDLYFPQFNFGIECNERHHKFQKDKDIQRAEDITSELNGYTYEPIIVYDTTLKEIHTKITNAVKKIKEKKNNQIMKNEFKKWEILTPQEYFKDKDKITVEDDIEFSTIKETSNLIFGTNYKGQQKSWFRIKTLTDKNIMAWFPQLAIEKDNIMVSSSNGWNNTINDSKDTIFEYNEFSTNNDFDKRERVTFMKMKDKITNKSSYKFLGVFLPVSKENGIVTYKRIDTEFKIIKN